MKFTDSNFILVYINIYIFALYPYLLHNNCNLYYYEKIKQIPNIDILCSVELGPPRGGGGRGGQLAPGPKQVGPPNLRNILKLNNASSKSGRVQGINGCIKRY